MEDIRTYRTDEDEKTRDQDRDRTEWSAAPSDDDVPFHIPRD
jgi:hypothetical protein